MTPLPRLPVRLRLVEFNGVVYSHSQLHRLTRAAGGMAGDVSDVRARFEVSADRARAALGDDDYSRMYLRARGRRLEEIGAGLRLLAAALDRQESKVRQASRNYRAGEDAGTPRA